VNFAATKLRTMFTIEQIKTAHAKVKNGADFPNYVQEIITLGVKSYNTYVQDGHTQYFGKDGYQLVSEPKYAALAIAAKSDVTQFIQCLKDHQQGQTDYKTFCEQAAATGVEKWTVDMTGMTCTYYNKEGAIMFTESIPAPA
jgi:uncharacterized protein YbcV (DUF1398 family)